MIKIPIEPARLQAARFLRDLGTPPHIATTVVDRLIAADLDDCPSHGLLRILEYRRAIQRGLLAPSAEPETTALSSTVFRVDGRRAFGALVSDEIVSVASAAAPGQAVLIGVRNSGHLGRLSHIARSVAATGRIILGFFNAGGGGQKVVPFGGLVGRIGTNPILFGCPSPSGTPIVVDVTTSTASDGAIQIAAAEGRPLPAGVLADVDGKPIREPERLNSNPPTAFITPLGAPHAAHKGYALAVAVEIMAGIVGGSDFVTPDRSKMGNCGFLITLPISCLGRQSQDFLADITALEKYLQDTPAAGDPVRLPGQGSRSGSSCVLIPDHVWHEISGARIEIRPPDEEGN